jgi:PTH1 family peptidyl-tRNA hydrolase
MPSTTLQLIVGLGNPGTEYARTRHNAGFWFLEALAERCEVRLAPDTKLGCEVGRCALAGESIWLAKPMRYMNACGQPVSRLLSYYKIEPERALLAHDDLDLPAGAARLKFDGGHGGQNGLRDVIAQLGHARFHRLRLGIGHPGHKDQVTNWVLGRPSKADEAAIRSAIDDALAVIELAVAGQFNEAMKRLHTHKERD